MDGFELSDETRTRIRVLSELTGKSIDEILTEAVDLLYTKTAELLRRKSIRRPHRADPDIVLLVRGLVEEHVGPTTTSELVAAGWPNATAAEIRSLSRKIGAALRELEYTKKQTMRDGQRRMVWFPPPELPVLTSATSSPPVPLAAEPTSTPYLPSSERGDRPLLASDSTVDAPPPFGLPSGDAPLSPPPFGRPGDDDGD